MELQAIFLYLFFSSSFPAYTSTGRVGKETDELALLAFKSEITEDPQGVLDSWNSTIHFCRWTGVTCAPRHQRVNSLDLGGLRLAGSISPHIGNLSFLRFLDLSDNSFHGVVPSEFGRLVRLQTMNLSFNQIRGEIPLNLSLCRSLVNLILDHNFLERRIPPELGSLTKLVMLYLKNNNLTGTIPASIGNLTSLKELYISYNELDGQFPDTMVQLKSLTQIGMSWNSLSGEFPPVIYNLSSLKLIGLSFNNFSGILRADIGLKFPNLQRLYLASNQFTGSIPASLSNCSELLQLDLPMNSFTGNIPMSLGTLKNLYWLNVLTNRLGSGAPDDLSFLQTLDLSNNNLTGAVPKEVIGISSLSIVVNISWNFLNGPSPEEVGNLTNLAALDLSGNKISGKIPSTLGNCLSLETLYMQGNSFQGPIPPTFNNLKNIKILDVSNNNLSGQVPQSMSKLSSLLYLNLSFNRLEGELPDQGVFGDASRIEVSGNEKLCGGITQLHLQPCLNQAPRKAKQQSALKTILITAILGSCLTLLLLLLLSFCWMKKLRSKTLSPSSAVDVHKKVSYQDLLNATSGFSLQNLIGAGNFGTVYRGNLGPDGTKIDVKVIKLQQRGASKSFLAECQVLRTIRHRNLVKILTACSSTDFHRNEFKALVYQYMPNGSLEKWLHPDDRHIPQRSLSIFQRMNIVVDVASALHYLHNLCETPVAHCDLKPSNVLLDDDLTAHVSDFGLARLLLNSSKDASVNQFSSIGIKGTIGYAAPEYGMGSLASTEGDVYSFGILLLEIFSRRPTDALFKDNENLHSFVQQALPDQVMDIVDQSAFYSEQPGELVETTNWESYSKFEFRECLISLFRIGLKCSEPAPQDRMKMMQVSMDLISVKEKFNKYGACGRKICKEGDLK